MSKHHEMEDGFAMMRFLPLSLLLALLLAVTTACADSSNKLPTENDTPPQAAVQEPAEVQDPPADPAEEPANDGGKEAAGTDEPAAQDDSPAAEEAPPKKLYRMTEAYRFAPIDPSAPDKAVLLTFDDGPKELEMLTSMLDTLDKHNAKAVFFVNGYRAAKKPELLTLIHDRGQMIGNHSWDHIDLKKEEAEKVSQQIKDVQDIVLKHTGMRPTLFRPPFGSGGEAVKAIAEREGLLYMTWSNGSLDWDASTKDKPDAVIANVLDQLHPGANILMHELPWTEQALDRLLTQLADKGYSFIDPFTIETPAAAAE
jgi:peptidoglycan-N-acetylglucosamine deacetylase